MGDTAEEIRTRSRQDMVAALEATALHQARMELRLLAVTEATTSTAAAAAAVLLLTPTSTPPLAAAAARDMQARLLMAGAPTILDLDLSKALACSCAPTFSAAAACGIIAGMCTTPAIPRPPKFATTSCAVAACVRAAGSSTKHPLSLSVPAILLPISNRLHTSSLHLRALMDMVVAVEVPLHTLPAPPFKSAQILLAAVACAATADSCTTLPQARFVTRHLPCAFAHHI